MEEKRRKVGINIRYTSNKTRIEAGYDYLATASISILIVFVLIFHSAKSDL